MLNSEAVSVLAMMVMHQDQAIAAVDRKKSWRDSEKAMAKSEYLRRKRALQNAIAALQAKA